MKLQNAILITGAGQRVGRYLAEQFLVHTTFPVIFTYRTHRPSVAQLQAKGAVAIQVDFTQPNALALLEKRVLQEVGSLRAVIHNASLWVKEGELSAQPALFQAMFEVHVKAPYAINQFCIPLLQACDGTADIIALTDANLEQGQADQIAYLATKSALHAMTSSFAKALAPKIKVNEIQPGLVVFKEADSDDYRQDRLSKMRIPKAPGLGIIWESVQFLMHLPNTTGTSVKLFGQ